MEKLSDNTNILIIEAEQTPAFRLRELLFELNFKNVNIFFDMKSGMEAIRILTPDIVFLGLTLNENLNGIDILKLLELHQIHTHVIIVSDHNQFSAEVLRFSPVDFLRKPVTMKDIRTSIRKVENHLNLHKSSISENNPQKSIEIIQIQSNQEVNFFMPDELIYMEADGSYSVLHLYKGKQETISQNLGKLSERLPAHQFIRVSRKHIVNMKYIKKYSKKDQQLFIEYNGSIAKIPSSKKYMQKILY
ncbi:LytR/AlgR family response regulator transcription factor [Mariniphaga sp.]|uniref:LytR/AlgR family response regulator transcription factor n=1 Tax=Mariniphaga sp. TaxID=1954475 RepID=UPI003564BDF4